MFPASYFAPRMFAPRYWPKVGATVLTDYVLFGTARNLNALVYAQSASPSLEAVDASPRMIAFDPPVED